VNVLDTWFSPEFTFELLRVTVLASVGMLLASFAILGLHKRRMIHLVHERVRLLEQSIAGLADVADGASDALFPVTRFEQAAALAKAVDLWGATDVQQDQRVRRAVAATGIEQLLRHTLEYSKWSMRYRCVSAIHDLGWEPLFDTLLEHAGREPNLRVHGHCLYACASVLRTPEQFLRLYEATEATEVSHPSLSEGFTESIFRTAIRKLVDAGVGQALNDTLDRCLQRLDSPCLEALVVSIGKTELGAMAASVNVCARASRQATIVIAAMRALHAMGQCDRLIIEELDADEKAVQITAIRCATHCGGQIADKLAELMGSHEFDVRYAAAMSLRALGQEGRRILDDVAASDVDAYAREMAAFALAME